MLSNHRNNKLLGVTTIIVLMLSIVFTHFEDIITYPREIRIIKGQEKIIDIDFPYGVNLKSDNNKLKLNKNNSTEAIRTKVSQKVTIKSDYKGKTNIEFKFLGIPLKTITVNTIPEFEIIPGGHSIGVKLKAEGLIVVGFSNVITGDTYFNPSKETGIKIGDIILKANGKKIKDPKDLISIINNHKEEKIKLDIRRDEEVLTYDILPRYNTDDKKYQIGLWVRDVTAGIGTLSFYIPESGNFGALGHEINDIDTGTSFRVKEGNIVESEIISIVKGLKDKPGEKKGFFSWENNILGYITKNTPYGIYGNITTNIQNPIYDTVKLGLRSHIEKGPAKMLTVVEGNKIENYDIEILRIFPQWNPEGKSMIIKVTDKNLISKAGGIVQGMSGSPIIQNKKLIGVVTHVFVNDPKKGYAIFAELMVDECLKQ